MLIHEIENLDFISISVTNLDNNFVFLHFYISSTRIRDLWYLYFYNTFCYFMWMEYFCDYYSNPILKVIFHFNYSFLNFSISPQNYFSKVVLRVVLKMWSMT